MAQAVRDLNRGMGRLETRTEREEMAMRSLMDTLDTRFGTLELSYSLMVDRYGDMQRDHRAMQEEVGAMRADLKIIREQRFPEDG